MKGLLQRFSVNFVSLVVKVKAPTYIAILCQSQITFVRFRDIMFVCKFLSAGLRSGRNGDESVIGLRISPYGCHEIVGDPPCTRYTPFQRHRCSFYPTLGSKNSALSREASAIQHNTIQFMLTGKTTDVSILLIRLYNLK